MRAAFETRPTVGARDRAIRRARHLQHDPRLPGAPLVQIRPERREHRRRSRAHRHRNPVGAQEVGAAAKGRVGVEQREVDVPEAARDQRRVARRRRLARTHRARLERHVRRRALHRRAAHAARLRVGEGRGLGVRPALALVVSLGEDGGAGGGDDDAADPRVGRRAQPPALRQLERVQHPALVRVGSDSGSAAVRRCARHCGARS